LHAPGERDIFSCFSQRPLLVDYLLYPPAIADALRLTIDYCLLTLLITALRDTPAKLSQAPAASAPQRRANEIAVAPDQAAAADAAEIVRKYRSRAGPC
jgi:hypothetical protein